MPFRILDQGIRAIQAGNAIEGARLLRIALKNETLPGDLRAVGWMWMAETQDDTDFKRDCYSQALAADPGNESVRQRMAHLLSNQLPPAPSPTTAASSTAEIPITPSAPAPSDVSFVMPPAPTNPRQFPVMGQSQAVPRPTSNQPQQPLAPQAQVSGSAQADFFRTVGLVGGPNGTGTGFFINHTGLVATTRYVVGSTQHLTATLEDSRHLQCYPVRSFPEFDLALVQINMNVPKLLPISPRQQLGDNVRLMAYTHNGKPMSGQCRSTRRRLPSQWFPTTISQVADAGGNPIFDERNYLVGMLTRNTSRTNKYVYGLHIKAVLECMDIYNGELVQDRNRTYCPTCGHSSRASSVDAFYCEVCGAVLPYARSRPRFPLKHTVDLYGDNMYPPCNHCGASVGYHDGTCLRCGKAVSPRISGRYIR